MKAKAIKKPSKRATKKVLNEEPIQPIPELSYNEIVKKLEESDKLIINSVNFDEYNKGWMEHDKYTQLKLNYKKV